MSKIEIKGFKSFGNTKVTLPLSKGLTAFVGPNGAGKSNVVDALCFVLGGMSAKTLRAERFSDLLFNGGNGQRPAPFAEISLHFDNEDGVLPINSKLVVISREADRSGRCVYRINKKRATRQEIVDMLSPSMSSPGGNNFVMQGDVDRFIKMDPIDRRRIIDDLAGVAEYDENKQRSLTELQRVETNLSSMRSALEEISTEMERLRSQREKVIRYRELKQELESIRRALLIIQRATHERELLQLRQEIRAKEDTLQELRGAHREISEQIENRERRIRDLQRLLEQKQKAEAFEEVRKIRERIAVFNQMIDSLQEECTKRKNEITEISARLEKIESTDFGKITSLSSRFNDLCARFNILVSTLEPNGSPAENQKILLEIRGTLNELNSVLGHLSEYLERARKLLESSRSLGSPNEFGNWFSLRDRLIGLNAVYSQLKYGLDQQLQMVREARSEFDEAIAREKVELSSIEALRKQKEELSHEVGSLREEGKRLDGMIKHVDEKLQTRRLEEASLRPRLENIEREFEKIGIETGVPETVDPAKLEQGAQAIEVELKALEPLNFRAIQDFRDAELRYNSKKSHYDKLVEEKNAILNFMQEIDGKKGEAFMRTFNEISKHFSEIFSELSPAGITKLMLENEEKPFDGGLEIEAKPAGKRISRIEALSGGEKALTALAFIFALQRFRPTALYVLDEIDAHLDPENLSRVAELVRRSSRKSQVILITLRDSMMSAADRLFGITIDKSGVSRLYSVELAGLAA